MKTILVPLDLSSVSKMVVDAAIGLARECGAQISLLHIIRPDLGTSEFPNYLEEISESSKQVLLSYKEILKTSGVDGSSILSFGQPVIEILEEAKHCKPIYIVMGSNCHSALYDLVLGSTVMGVLRSAPCPVLVVNEAAANRRTNALLQQEEAVHA